ncbi:hypothetical protein P154DRAFT_543871 [Amniculicola lignicola CBS 123094]|uniref:DUF3176 domain containing protein n=1 Tax=Amniculicola lignicola CBS 123094 TaxID=1392246 RepID=A0A6A5WRT5_9PLEO|nr:hypothetical protein P154DRAFT_543871 [Amniculicola lignicola CBS 123094]
MSSTTQHQWPEYPEIPTSLDAIHEKGERGSGSFQSTFRSSSEISHTTNFCSPPNIAQRIEKRLWNYNASGSLIKSWLLEILSWVTSAICMGAIVLVLLSLQNKKIPRWPLGLTLNTVASAALLKWSWFHGESKKIGPWGSFLLLIRTKGKHLAALGAAITIFALALDPFFQQGVSQIPRVVRYEPRYAALVRGGVEYIQPDQAVVATAAKFFYDYGIEDMPARNGTSADVPLSCPASNCTWELYNTLGVCSMCEDVSELLTYDCKFMTVDWSANLTGLPSKFEYQNQTVCGYFLDLNSTTQAPVLMSGYIVDGENSTAGEALLMRSFPLVTNPTRRPIFGGSINFKHIRNPIADFLITSAGDNVKKVYKNDRPTTHECVLTWCVKSIQSSYLGGTYKEEIKETLNTTKGDFPWRTELMEVDGMAGYLTFYAENVTIGTHLADQDDEIFGVSNLTMINIIGVTDEILPSITTVGNSTATPFLKFREAQTGKYLLRKPPSNPWLRAKDIPDHLERFATALTNVIRSSASKQFVDGKAYELEAYVFVRWFWLVLPLSLLIGSFFFLIATMIRAATEKYRIGIWKTSAVATLYNGLPDKMQQKITSSTWVGTPRTKAKELRIKLSPHKGWRTSGNILSPMTPKVRRYQPPPGWI